MKKRIGGIDLDLFLDFVSEARVMPASTIITKQHVPIMDTDQQQFDYPVSIITRPSPLVLYYTCTDDFYR